MAAPLLDTHVLLLKALADESRLALIALIAKEELSVGTLAERLRLSEPTVSHHLAKLNAVGLTTVRASGTTRFHRLDPTALHNVGKSMVAHAAEVPAPAAADDEEARVLASFIVAGRVTKIPEGRKKRLIVLRWLVAQFKERKLYKEREVNEVIKRFHPDFATIRREFIGHGLMERENGTYWRVQEPAA